ncbi:MAG TPA: BamA/TamA family outer membrane protein [Kofleriaceae bacterium]|jgi:outer membrane protein assembly factor BamA
MNAMRTCGFASLVVGVVGTARGEPTVAVVPGASDGSGASTTITDLPPGETPPVAPPKPTGTFYIGGSYATDVGYAATAGISQSNLFHTGNALSLDATIGQRLQRYDMKFVDPHLASGRMTLTVDVYNDRSLLGATGIWRQAAGIDASISTAFGDHVHTFFGYRLESVQNTGVIAWFRDGIDYNSLNNKEAPTRGTSAGVTTAVGNIDAGDVDLIRVDAWFNTHQPLGPFTFHTGGRFAAIDTNTDLTNVPFSEMLFFGGPNDVRGFGYGQGPGAVDPGNLMATWRTELELPIAHDVSVRGFWDVGTLVQANGTGILAQSVGGGVLWRSPVGPISVDYAVPFEGTAPHFLFAFGQTF